MNRAGFLFFTFLFVHSLWAHAFTTTHRLNLKETLQWAEDHSPDFQKLRHSLKVAELEAENGRKFWMPQLDLSTTHGVLDRDPRAGYEPWNSSFDITLSENLYDDGQSFTKKKITQKQLELAQAGQKIEREKLTLALATQFLQYSLAIKSLEVQEAQLALIRKQFGSTSRDYHQGMKTQRDYLRFKTQLSRSEIDVLTTRNNVLKEKKSLIRLIGGDSSDIELDFIPLPLMESQGNWNSEKMVLEKHPRYFAYLLALDIEDLQTSLSKKVLTPSLTLSAGSSYGSANYLNTGQRFQDNDSLSWNILLTLKYNLFDGGIRNRSYQVVAERSEITKKDLRGQMLSLKSELEQWALNYEQIQSNQRLATELFELEKKNRSLMEADYRNGKVAFLDFITSLRDYLDAQFKFYSSVYDSEISRMTYLSYKGTLHEALLR